MTTATRSQTNHKEAATRFLQMAATGDVRRAFAQFVAPTFKHHNIHFPGDAQSLADAMQENASQNPEKAIEILRAIEEDDIVVVHSRLRQRPGTPEFALAHIFRFEDDKVVELWDLAQEVPAETPNEHGMF